MTNTTFLEWFCLFIKLVSLLKDGMRTSKKVSYLHIFITLFKLILRSGLLQTMTAAQKSTLDVTDCPIKKPEAHRGQWNKKWYSYTFHGPGLWYKWSVAMQINYLVWPFWPFPCESHTDPVIERMNSYKCKYQMILADGGYRNKGDYFDKPTSLTNKRQYMRSIAQIRLENHNGKNKQFLIWSSYYRGDLNKHYFFTIAFTAPKVFDNGNNLF